MKKKTRISLTYSHFANYVTCRLSQYKNFLNLLNYLNILKPITLTIAIIIKYLMHFFKIILYKTVKIAYLFYDVNESIPHV